MTRRRTRGASAALATGDELWAVLPPKQARSVELIQRIATAGKELFTATGYDSVSVADIAAAAGISVGAFYTRFASKEHLVVHLLREVADELTAAMDRDMNPERIADCGVRDVVHRYLTMMAAAFVQHRGLLGPASLIARRTADADLQAILRRFNEGVHGRFRGLLLARLGAADTDAAVVARIDVAVLWSSAAMREVLLYGEPVSSLSRRHSTLIDELTRGVTLYLETPVDA